MKHSPTPWEIYDSDLTKSKVIRNERGSICWLSKPMHFTGQDDRYKAELEEYEANGHLLLSAPDLREACEGLIKANRHAYEVSLRPDTNPRGTLWNEARSKLSAACLQALRIIQKAKGELS